MAQRHAEIDVVLSEQTMHIWTLDAIFADGRVEAHEIASARAAILGLKKCSHWWERFALVIVEVVQLLRLGKRNHHTQGRRRQIERFELAQTETAGCPIHPAA